MKTKRSSEVAPLTRGLRSEVLDPAYEVDASRAGSPVAANEAW